MPGGLDMSFSGEVKEELQTQVAAARHCQIAELASILHFAEVTGRQMKLIIRMKKRNPLHFVKCF